MKTCIDCRLHYRERHWRIFQIELCGRTDDVVGFECPVGCVGTEGCAYYERRFTWHEGAIA